MIKSFADRETEKIWKGEQSKVLPAQIQHIARRKLRMMNNAETINDLRIPPANQLKKLKGKLSNFYSIRINDQWRIVFLWKTGNAEQVEIVDHHD